MGGCANSKYAVDEDKHPKKDKKPKEKKSKGGKKDQAAAADAAAVVSNGDAQKDSSGDAAAKGE